MNDDVINRRRSLSFVIVVVYCSHYRQQESVRAERERDTHNDNDKHDDAALRSRGERSVL
jgi:hypothetical protein